MVSPSLAIAGAERLVVDIAIGLSARGCRVAVAAPDGPLRERLPSAIARFGLRPAGRSPVDIASQVRGLACAVRRFAPDVVHAHNPKMTIVSAIACRARQARRPVLVSTFHGVTPDEYRRAAVLLRPAEHVVAVSAATRMMLERTSLPAARLSTIENGITVSHVLSTHRRAVLDAELGARPGPVVATVGRLVPQKAPDLFVEAAALVARQRPDTRFLMVGDGPLRTDLERQVDEAGLSARLRFLGVRPDARDLIAWSDVLVFSSHWEGLSVAALEALAAEVPVVSTDVEGMRDLLATGAGIIVHSRAPEALAAEIVRLVDDPGLRAMMGRVGRRLVEQRYSTERMVSEYVELYRRLSRLRPAAPR